MTGDAMRDVIASGIMHAIDIPDDELAEMHTVEAIQSAFASRFLAAITAAPASARLALARAITPDTHALVAASSMQDFMHVVESIVNEGAKMRAALGLDPEVTRVPARAFGRLEQHIAAARGADAEGGK